MTETTETTETTAGRVVVGFDGRWQGMHLLDVAATEAIRLARPLTVLTLIHGTDEVAALEGRRPDGWHPHTVVRHRLREAAEHIHARHPDLRVATRSLYYFDVHGDVELLRTCPLLVLGESGNHDVAPLVPGSASSALTQAVTCPVLTVREPVPTS